MAGKSRSYPGWQLLLLLLVLGGIIGGWLGDAIVKLWPAAASFGSTYNIGIPDFNLNLMVFDLSFGFMLHINLFTILGFVLAYFVFRRL